MGSVKRKIPLLVVKMRQLSDTNEDRRWNLLYAAGNLIKTIASLNTPPDQIKNLSAYRSCLNEYRMVTGKDWVDPTQRG